MKININLLVIFFLISSFITKELRKTKTKVKTKFKFSDVMSRIKDNIQNLKCDSCQITSWYIVEAVAKENTITDLISKDEMPTTYMSSKTEENINKALDEGKLVTIAVNPDHIFTILENPENKDFYLFQGFQETYTFSQWMANHNDGKIISRSELLRKLNVLLKSRSPLPNQEMNHLLATLKAVSVALFAPKFVEKKITDEIKSYFLNNRINLKLAQVVSYEIDTSKKLNFNNTRIGCKESIEKQIKNLEMKLNENEENIQEDKEEKLKELKKLKREYEDEDRFKSETKNSGCLSCFNK